MITYEFLRRGYASMCIKLIRMRTENNELRIQNKSLKRAMVWLVLYSLVLTVGLARSLYIIAHY